jgi:hypothetical protein
MALETLASYPDDKALQFVAHLIDSALDLDRNDGNDKALIWCGELEQRPLAGANLPLLDYFRANAWNNRQRAENRDVRAAWNWDQQEALEQIRSLRRAVRQPEFEDLDAVRESQIFTNLASQLNSLGRFVEAVPMWTRALVYNPQFGMALGNRGLGLSEYGRALYDPGYRERFYLFAHRDLSAALADRADYAGYEDLHAKADFAQRRASLEAIIDVSKVERAVCGDDDAMGSTEDERRYRQWALAEGLFLNPLNDLGVHAIAARDVFGLPSFTTDLDEPPTLVGLFNQMKQEYVSARWMLYEGTTADGPHFSDRDVTLHNTLDYPTYSVAVEKVKAAFRIAYSLFDKIAFFLNDYKKLGVNAKSVYFRSIWYANQDARNGALRTEFADLQNWPFRGLFYLAKDLYEPSLQATAEPDAQQLYLIRNCLEHSYLKVHEMLLPGPREDNAWRDRLAYSVQREDFYRRRFGSSGWPGRA